MSQHEASTTGSSEHFSFRANSPFFLIARTKCAVNQQRFVACLTLCCSWAINRHLGARCCVGTGVFAFLLVPSHANLLLPYVSLRLGSKFILSSVTPRRLTSSVTPRSLTSLFPLRSFQGNNFGLARGVPLDECHAGESAPCIDGDTRRAV